MKIKRTFDTTQATYDLLELTDQEFSILCKAYEHYMYYIRHCPPAEEDSMWQKMRKLMEERITIF
jgi:hypothetical protein